tara:strand:- start:5778 stop:8507 length:2730 start_codon:yes stop_codon:yes gene_type:complete
MTPPYNYRQAMRKSAAEQRIVQPPPPIQKPESTVPPPLEVQPKINPIPISQPEVQPETKRERALKMTEFLRQTYTKVKENIGARTSNPYKPPPFPWTDPAHKEEFKMLVRDRLLHSQSGQTDEDIHAYLHALGLAHPLSVTPMPNVMPTTITGDPVVKDLTPEEERQYRAEMQAREDQAAKEAPPERSVSEGEIPSEHYEMFMDRNNMSPIVLELLRRDLEKSANPKLEAGIEKGARYALSDRRKYDFFIKNPSEIPDINTDPDTGDVMVNPETGEPELSITNKLMGLGFGFGEGKMTRSQVKDTLAYILQDQDIQRSLDMALTDIIQNLKNVGDIDIASLNTKELASKMAPLEKYVIQNMNYKAKEKKTKDWERAQKEKGLAVDKDTGATIDPGEGKAKLPDTITEEEKAETALDLKELSEPIIAGIAGLSTDIADWWRRWSLAKKEGANPNDESDEAYKLSRKKRISNLAFADTFQAFGTLAQTKLMSLLDPKNQQTLEDRGNAVGRGEVVYSVDGKGNKVVVFQPKRNEEGFIVDYDFPTLNQLISNDEVQKELALIYDDKNEILQQATTRQGLGQFSSAEALAKELNMDPTFVKSTLSVGEEGLQALEKEISDSNTKNNSTHRLISAMGKIKELKETYGLAAVRAFFSIGGMHKSFEKPANLDPETGLAQWVDSKKQYIVAGDHLYVKSSSTGSPRGIKHENVPYTVTLKSGKEKTRYERKPVEITDPVKKEQIFQSREWHHDINNTAQTLYNVPGKTTLDPATGKQVPIRQTIGQLFHDIIEVPYDQNQLIALWDANILSKADVEDQLRDNARFSEDEPYPVDGTTWKKTRRPLKKPQNKEVFTQQELFAFDILKSGQQVEEKLKLAKDKLSKFASKSRLAEVEAMIKSSQTSTNINFYKVIDQ